MPAVLKVFALAKASPMSWRPFDASRLVCTPNAERTGRRALKAEFAEARATAARIRELLATGRLLDREEAEALFEELILLRHTRIRDLLYRLRVTQVKKYSNLSEHAAARMAARSRS